MNLLISCTKEFQYIHGGNTSALKRWSLWTVRNNLVTEEGSWVNTVVLNQGNTHATNFSLLHLSPTIYHSWPTKTTYCSKLYSSPSTFECCLGFFIVLWVREITSPSNAFYWPWYRSWMKGCSKYMAFNSINSISNNTESLQIIGAKKNPLYFRESHFFLINHNSRWIF